MATLSRQLIALDMLSQDMQDALDAMSASDSLLPSDYLRHLTRYRVLLGEMQSQLPQFTDSGFQDLVESSNVCSHLISKRMVAVLGKLVGYVLDYYDATHKASHIEANDFDEQADKRLGLLHTKAIKARAQFRTVAQAMGPEEYQHLVQGVPLPGRDWQWHKLGIAGQA